MTIKENIIMGIVERELHEVGINIKHGDSYRPFNDVVIEGYNKWETMTDDQKQNVKNLLSKIK